MLVDISSHSHSILTILLLVILYTWPN
jgi:hypothetical protein